MTWSALSIVLNVTKSHDQNPAITVLKTTTQRFLLPVGVASATVVVSIKSEMIYNNYCKTKVILAYKCTNTVLFWPIPCSTLQHIRLHLISLN